MKVRDFIRYIMDEGCDAALDSDIILAIKNKDNGKTVFSSSSWIYSDDENCITISGYDDTERSPLADD